MDRAIKLKKVGWASVNISYKFSVGKLQMRVHMGHNFR
jgi:hypothetical protein